MSKRNESNDNRNRRRFRGIMRGVAPLLLTVFGVIGASSCTDHATEPLEQVGPVGTASLALSFSNHPTARSATSSSLPDIDYVHLNISGENIPDDQYYGWDIAADDYEAKFEILVPEGRNQIIQALAIASDGQVIRTIAAPVSTVHGTSVSARVNMFTTPTALLLNRLGAPVPDHQYELPSREVQDAVNTIIGLDSVSGTYQALPWKINLDALELAVRNSIEEIEHPSAITAADILAHVGVDILLPADDSGAGLDLDFGFPGVSMTATPAEGFLPLEVTFDVVASGFGGAVRQFKWDFDGDGRWDSIEQNPVHAFTTEGVFDATVEVRDNTGALATTSIAIQAYPRIPGTGRVRTAQKISATSGEFMAPLRDGDELGHAVAALGDFDGDGVGDVVVGARYDKDGGLNRGAVYLQMLTADGKVKDYRKISALESDLTAPLADHGWFGSSVTSLGDLDGDGVTDIAVGAPGFDGLGGVDRGAVYILFLREDGTVREHAEINGTTTDFGYLLLNSDWFGSAVTGLGDLDGDGVPDLAVSAPLDDDGGPDRGAVYVLFLTRTGRVKDYRIISDTEGGFLAPLKNSDWFGTSLSSVGDLDGDGVDELAVGASRDDDGGVDRGAVYILYLQTDGTVDRYQKISASAGNFHPTFIDGDWFGTSATGVGDIDADGVPDLVVGASGDNDKANECGALYVLFLTETGEVKRHQKISGLRGKFLEPLDPGDQFGVSVAAVGDLDGDRLIDLVTGASYDDDGGTNRGALYTLFLE